MSEPRKNHLSIDGGQVKEDDTQVASYKPIPETDTDFRTSKSSLAKSKEKVSPDGAEEKLLSKEDEAKIVRVDMAEATYVVGDHRNGDAKIELDANKRQFSGLTKEELMKYADDVFWVRLRWAMFVLFWAAWLAMLAGAITIIVRAPKCAPPTPREWFEKYPMIESDGASLEELEGQLGVMKSSHVGGVFVSAPAYEPAESNILANFKAFIAKAKEQNINVIVDLVPNYVSLSHPWFLKSVNRTAPYTDYFVWANTSEFDEEGNRKPPNRWVSVYNTSAWKYHEGRQEFYLRQYGEEQPDLNFNNELVAAELRAELAKWMEAGVMGVRLNKARELVVSASLKDETPLSSPGRVVDAVHTMYPYWRHQETSDLPRLDALLASFAPHVRTSDDKVFTLKEDGSRAELYLLERNVSSLRPVSAAPVPAAGAAAAARALNTKIGDRWPMLQLKGDIESEPELALFAMLLPAAPVLTLLQIQGEANDTTLAKLVELRDEASIEQGAHAITAVPAAGDPAAQLLACARWKAGQTGYVAVWNPAGGAARANLTAVPSVPRALAVRAVSLPVAAHTNYTTNAVVQADNVLVPGKSTVVLSYVPQTAAAS